MRALFTLTALTATLLAAPVQANKVYRWTDENGQVHFSSQPPRGLNDDLYKFHVDKPADPPPAKPESEKVVDKQPKAKQEEQKPSIDPIKAKEYCRQARDAKTKVSANFNRRFKQEDGSFRPLTDKERADMIKRANESIAAYCK